MENDKCKQVAFIQLRGAIERCRVAKRFLGRTWYDLSIEYNLKDIWFKSPDDPEKAIKIVFESGFGEGDLKSLSQLKHWTNKSVDDIRKMYLALNSLSSFLYSLL